MAIYHCILTLHDNVFFATREMGILYETEKYLHNWALSYAFFKISHISHPYRLEGIAAQKPDYLDATAEQSLIHLNQANIYVFPAKPLHWSYQINTFKAAQTTYYGKSKQFGDKGADRNYPINYGRAKELAVGSKYRSYIIAPEGFQDQIPQWIRLGKWAAKTKVEVVQIPSQLIKIKKDREPYICEHPLNPIDLPPNTKLLLYNRIVMSPASLVSASQLVGNYWEVAGKEWEKWQKENSLTELPKDICLPAGVFYGASHVATAS